MLGSISLTLVSVLSLAGTPGCARRGNPVAPGVVEDPRSELDRMLEFVPEDAEFVIVRDASVLADYLDEGARFFDGPMAALQDGGSQGTPIRTIAEQFFEFEARATPILAELDAAGVELHRSVAVVKDRSGEGFIVFHASDPNALVQVGEALGEQKLRDVVCKSIPSAPGLNVCGDERALVDAYVPSGESAAQRRMLEEALFGVEIDDANLVARVDESDGAEEFFMALTTAPGSVHMAIAPGRARSANMIQTTTTGPAGALAHVSAGSGFVWVRVGEAVMAGAVARSKDTFFAPLLESLTGEFLLSGSADPGGVVVRMGADDVSMLEDTSPRTQAVVKVLASMVLLGQLPGVPESSLSVDHVSVSGRDRSVRALHARVRDIPEADAIARRTGLHPEGWVFAADDGVTMAVGPDARDIGALLDGPAGIRTPATDGLHPVLVRDITNERVALIVHMPLDFLQGPQMRGVLGDVFERIADLEAPTALAVVGALAPLSSSTFWLTADDGQVVMHLAARSIGSRATEEGRAALEAAHAVAEGTDSAEVFGRMADAYGASPMARAYRVRAGRLGSGPMIGSGVGAVLAAAASFLVARVDPAAPIRLSELWRPEAPEAPERPPMVEMAVEDWGIIVRMPEGSELFALDEGSPRKGVPDSATFASEHACGHDIELLRDWTKNLERSYGDAKQAADGLDDVEYLVDERTDAGFTVHYRGEAPLGTMYDASTAVVFGDRVVVCRASGVGRYMQHEAACILDVCRSIVAVDGGTRPGRKGRRRTKR